MTTTKNYTLYMLESGLSKASDTTKNFFKRTPMFFIRDNHNGTYSFLDFFKLNGELTTSTIKSVNKADNGYMRIETQNSVINVTPACFGKYNQWLIPNIITDTAQWNINSIKISEDDIPDDIQWINFLEDGYYDEEAGNSHEYSDYYCIFNNRIYFKSTESTNSIVNKTSIWTYPIKVA